MADFDGVTDVVDLSGNGKGVALNVFGKPNATGQVLATTFGVTGDPDKDDTTALRLFLLYLAANGGVGVLPGGESKVTSAISITANAFPFRVVGPGRDLYKIVRAANIGTPISFTSCSNIDLEGFELDGGNAEYPLNSNHAVSVLSCSYMKWKNISVKNYKNSPILTYTGGATVNEHIYYEDMFIDGLGVANNGAFLEHVDYSGIKDTHVKGTPGNPGHGLQLKNNCQYGFIADSSAENCTYGASFASDEGVGPSFCQMRNLQLRNNTWGIAFGYSNDCSVDNALIDHNNQAAGTYAVRLENSNRNKLKSIHIKNVANLGYAIFISNSNDNVIEVFLGNVPTNAIAIVGTSARNTIIVHGVTGTMPAVLFLDNSTGGGNKLIFAEASDTKVLSATTTDATPTVLTEDGNILSAANALEIPSNKATAFKGRLIGRNQATGDAAVWEITGLIKRAAGVGTANMIGAPTITKTHNDASTAWTIGVTANTTYGSIDVSVTGVIATTIKWSLHLDVFSVG